MKVLVAKRKSENKLRYYNGKTFVIGKNRAVDISIRNDEETINKFIEMLYKHAENTTDADDIDYFTMDI